MAVAKSYQNLEIVKEPYMVSGRMYVQVKLGNGMPKQVRWYSDKEYAKYYPNEAIPADPFKKSQKEALGFVDGFITIFKGNTYPCKEWFKENGAKYTKFWGWSFASNVEVPTELPEGIEAIRLDWNVVGIDENLKPDSVVKTAIEALMYEPDNSEFQGEVGQRLELTVTVEKALHLNGYYGPSTMHIMRDENGNAFVWTTASKSWEEGSVKTIRGTVKAHKTYRNVNQTILTRCSEVKGK